MAVEDDGWPQGLEPIAQVAVETALRLSKLELKGPVAVSVLLTDDAGQKALNSQWRQQDKPTNVLSFPAIAPFGPVIGLIGDISLARETLKREADDLGKSFTHHFTHLLVHGVLHCLGYDHENNDDALVMEGLETQILAQLGIDDPYALDIT